MAAQKRKASPPIKLTEVSDEMESWESNCHCDFPTPGESGVIECSSCAIRRWRRAVFAAIQREAQAEELLEASELLYGSATLLLTGRCSAQLAEEQMPNFKRASDAILAAKAVMS